MRRLAIAGLCAALACSDEPERASDETPVTPAATVVIEPPRLRVGEVGVVEVAVVTPRGHRVAPLRPPEAVDGLWILDAEARPIEVDGAREIRRTWIRVRAREVGATEWPALAVEIESPEGARTELATEPRPLEVVSVLPVAPERVEPFRYRLPADGTSATSAAVAAAAGAGATLALLGLGAALRTARRRQRARRELEHAVAATQPWLDARAALAQARALPAAEWRAAGAAGARALRRYLARRYDLAAAESSASEELGSLPRPFLRAERWQAALACLRELDGERFRGRPQADAPARIAAALDAALELVRATSPDDERSTAGDA